MLDFSYMDYPYCFYFILILSQIGPVKVSHLWKGAILLFLIFVILREKKVKLFIYGPLLLLSILQLVSFELHNNPFNAVIRSSTTLIIPLIGIYVLRFKPEQLKLSLMFFSSLFILSFVPYQIGLLSSLGTAYELNVFGGADAKGIVGPFAGKHDASTALASSLLVVVSFWLSNTYSKWLLSALFALGFYFLFHTYVRTGMAMFAIGLLPIAWFFGKQSIVKFVRLIIVLSLSALFISSWVLSNETMMKRITGERVGSSEIQSFEQLGSARGWLYLSSLQVFTEANLVEKIIGVGQTETLNRIENKTSTYGSKHVLPQRTGGKRVFPHNGFLQILLCNGILALLIYLAFIRNVYKLQKGMRQLDSKILMQALFFAYLTMTFFQSYDLFVPFLLLMISIAFSYKSYLIQNRI